MQITELLKLTKWFKDFVMAEQIPTKYQQLFNMMNKNSQPNQQKQSFETQRENLFTSLKTVSLNKLTLEQIKFLKQLEIADLLGNEGVRNIEAVMYENNIDIATAAKKIGEFNTRITTANQKITELETTLSKSFTIESEDEIPEDSVMMRIYFQDESSINNIVDFKKLAATWFDIGRGIAMAQNKSPEDFRIIGAQKGSVIVELAVIAGIATSVSTILLAGLKVAERVIEILKKAEELKKLKLNNKKIEQEIVKEAEAEKKNGINTILETAIADLGLTKGQDGDKITSLEKSISKLIDFTQKGGAVDFIQPNGEDDDDEENVREETLQLKENVQDIRKLENKIKMLESKLNK
jgi:hypothetical protein